MTKETEYDKKELEGLVPLEAWGKINVVFGQKEYLNSKETWKDPKRQWVVVRAKSILPLLKGKAYKTRWIYGLRTAEPIGEWEKIIEQEKKNKKRKKIGRIV